MYKGKKISLIFPAYNEEKNIGKAISDFKKLKIIDEILVIDNNSKDRTSEIAKLKKAKVILEKKQGYGNALRRGLKEVKGDLIAFCEPDATFSANDLLKLLRYIDKYEIVLGTRTNSKFIEKNANMHGFLRIGNIVLARIIQFLYNPFISLTDCGCTFRVMRRSSIENIIPKFKVGGSYFLSEFIVLALLNNNSIIEVPVHYNERVGKSKITGSLKKSILVGLKMFETIIRYRFKI